MQNNFVEDAQNMFCAVLRQYRDPR